MGEFLLVSRSTSDDRAAALSTEIQKLAAAADMAVSQLTPMAWLAVSGPHAPRQTRVGHWLLVGDALNRRKAALPSTHPSDPFDYERKLMARFWGRYVGLQLKTDGTLEALLRDPSGALDCVVWEQDGLILAGSSAPEWLTRRLRPTWTIDFTRLAQVMRRPLLASADLLLEGPVSVLPGSLQPLPLGTPAEILWRPAEHARRSLDEKLSVDAAALRLTDALDEAAAGLADLAGPVAAEVSGGLDSSLVAASLVRSKRPVVGWLNAYGITPESDERPYVAVLGEKLGIRFTSSPHATGPLSLEALQQVSRGFRPPIAALDIHHDLDWAGRIESAGASALMTGKGGDSILVQAVTTEVFTDLWVSRGARALLGPDALKLAAINEVSIWTLVRDARRWPDAPPGPSAFAGLISTLGASKVVHPWLTDCEDFGPAKLRQIAGVADSVSRHGPSLLTDRIDVRHPLCSQPVIEACLSIPISLMTLGVRDRGLARHAFRDRLPDLIAERRSKGDMSSIYGHMILDNLDLIRPFLLEGRLISEGVLDPEATDAALSREQLTWHGRYAAIMVAVAFEAWVRAWEARLSSRTKG